MKKTIKNLALAASLTIFSLAIPSSYAKNSSAVIKNLGNFIIKVESTLDQFFNTNNKTSYNEYVISLGKTINDFEQKLEEVTRTPDDQCLTESYEIANYGRQQFNAAYGIIKQYKGKPAACAGKFVEDLEKVFSPERAFNAISKKLTSLYKKAEQSQDHNLMHMINQLTLLIEKKKNDWISKNQLALLRGLMIRMSCK